MWELICHHHYCWGTIAADRSKWRSDGFTAGVEPLPGEAGLRFRTQHSRIVIPRKGGDAWGSMRAVRAEIVASRPRGAGAGHLAGGGVLIDADQCFRVSFDDGTHEVILHILGQTLSFRLGDIPEGTWITIHFSHDGVNQLEYGWSYTLASGLRSGFGSGTPFSVPGQVPAVGPEGVWIGNRIGAPAGYLNGNIQSVKIWRLDPDAMTKTFLARPFTPSELDCWVKFKKKMDEAARQDPECAAWLDRTLGQIRNDFLQRLSQKTPEKVAEFRAMCTAYQALWAAGNVGSSEMQALIARLRDWLKSEQLFSADDPDLQGTLSSPCFRSFTSAVGGLECDPQAQALLNAMLGA